MGSCRWNYGVWFFEKHSVENKNLFDADFSELKLSDNRIYTSAPKKRERLNKLVNNEEFDTNKTISDAFKKISKETVAACIKKSIHNLRD